VLVAVVIVVLCAAALTAWIGIRRHQRANRSHTMVITTMPGIELDQPYGAWDADAYDSDWSSGLPPLTPSLWHSGPPSTWGRMLP
jgi:hypothetical protein